MRWPSFLPSFRRATPDTPLQLQTRLATLEGEMLSMRAQLDTTHTTIKRLQGKVYRGVPLGETVDLEPPDAPETPEATEHEHGVIPMAKADLYLRAAQLRGR